MIYVDEALKGQLTAAASLPPAPTAGGPTSWAALREEVLELVERALQARSRDTPALTEEPTAVAQALEKLMGSGATEVPGAPSIPRRAVRGTKGGAPVGQSHAVLTMDPLLPESLWVTRCGWHFARSEHALLGGEEPVTCKLCNRGAGKEGKRQRQE